jgi:hypothetical protein
VATIIAKSYFQLNEAFYQMKKIILHHQYGQMANRMVLLCHFIAYCLDRKISLDVYNFEPYIKFFDSKQIKEAQKKSIKFKRRGLKFKLFLSIIYRKKGFLNTKMIDIRESHDSKELQFNLSKIDSYKNKVILPEGWLFRTEGLIQKYNSDLKSLFQVNKKYNQSIFEFWSKTNPAKIRVGLHIRRGDYLNFKNGKYYFKNEVYIQKMKEFQKLFKSNEIQFILFSDEEVNFYDIDEYDTLISENKPIIDFFLLSKCEYIIGPPSTFSLVAAFLGSAQLYNIIDSNKKMQVNDFEKILEL